MVQSVFPDGLPERFEWTDRASILLVLNKIGNSKALNHTFMPNGGGHDLIEAFLSHEPGCIELRMDGLPYIVKPCRLTFHSFPDADSEWCFFRLESGTLEPAGIYNQLPGTYEEVCELSPGHYINRDAIDSGYYEGGPVPSNARAIARILFGDFVIFSKASTYNRNPGTYDARHEKMGDKRFREYIMEIILHLRESGKDN